MRDALESDGGAGRGPRQSDIYAFVGICVWTADVDSAASGGGFLQDGVRAGR
ncbi:MAG: hypothetical protein ABI625_00800 [bacterium]